ncbi:MAG TPA: hypothetical protein VMW88_02445, partial [Thermoplasmata archaeon]|nr:hypothetical protein [Thermoplasmata archaeon]
PVGRDHSRIHYKGNSAGIVEISGKWRYTDGQYKRVDAMMKAGLLIGYASNKLQVPSAYIISHDYQFKEGHPTTPYTITLMEAR